ncbi:MAG: restriction endonuclease subunit S [Blastocatellia bacterium]
MTTKMKGWKTAPLGELVKFASGGTPSREVARFWNGDTPWLSAKDLKKFRLSDSIEKVTQEGANHGTRLIGPGTVLILVRGMTLLKDVPVGVTERDVAFNQDLKALIPNGKVDGYYLGFYLTANKTRLLSLVDQTGHGAGRLPSDLLQSFKIELPELQEQRKIADILLTWDRAIEQAEKLITAKTLIKRGLMQQLPTGKKRFKGFAVEDGEHLAQRGAGPNDWEHLHIGDIAREVSSKNTNGKNLTVLSCTKHHGLVDSLKYFGKRVFSENTGNYKVVKRGQFAYATNHIEEGSIGYQDLYDEALISPMYTVFETNGRVDDSFLYQLLKTERYRHIFESNTSGSIDQRGGLRWKDFARIKVALPSLPEQCRIASALDACDRELDLLRQQLAAIERQNQGLMQKLLTEKIPMKQADV